MTAPNKQQAAEVHIDEIRRLLDENYGKKKTLRDANQAAVDLGYAYAREHFACPLPIRAQRMDATRDAILIDGNTAAGLGCVYAGATVGAWYPITPATSVMALSGPGGRTPGVMPRSRARGRSAACAVANEK